MQVDPIQKVQNAISNIEEAFIETYEILGYEKPINEILSIPKELERYIKNRLYVKGLISTRRGLKWEKAEDLQLIKEVKSSKNVDEIAKIHQRTCFAIEKRIEKLYEEGLL